MSSLSARLRFFLFLKGKTFNAPSYRWGALSFFAHTARVSHAVENSEPRSIFVPYITFRGVQHWWTCGASDTAAARPLMTGRPDANFGLDKCRGLFACRTQLPSLDDFVGSDQQTRRYTQPERLSGLAIDNERNLC